MSRKWSSIILVSFFCLFFTGCGTYYSQYIKFHKLFSHEKIADADYLLAKNKRSAKGRNRLLYYLNRGVTHHLLQQYQISNQFFEEAYLIYEDFVANPITETLAFLINANVSDYRGEVHEILLIHYYKALNYLQLQDLSAALVECRRLNIHLNQMADKNSRPDAYRRDAFIHVLMGLIYQANQEYNDAFIAYRNAINIYEEDYRRLYQLEAPLQLKKDVIYCAYKTGFKDQVTYYKKKFQLAYDPAKENNTGQIICLWNNGLGPVKTERNINFILVKGASGVINFVNEDLGLVFPFPLNNDDPSGTSLSDLHLLKVSFPKYVERSLLYKDAIVYVQGNKYYLEKAEDINAISFQVLHQRMLTECSKSLLRVALKKVAEHKLRQQNEILGTVLGVINFVTEKADTRNWQTLPHSIYYTRISLPTGNHQLNFEANSMQSKFSKKKVLSIEIHNNQTIFYPIHTIDYIYN